MAEVVLFHHALGLTPGCLSLAGRMRAGGHRVHTPDLYEGTTFAALVDGVLHAEEIGFDTIVERGRAAAEGLPQDVVYAGLSLGVMPAQVLAQGRAGAKGALLLSSCVTPSDLGAPWPDDVPAQVHLMESDEWVVEADLEAARALASSVAGAELFTYPGDGHLFFDDGVADYDEAATALLLERALRFLETVG